MIKEKLAKLIDVKSLMTLYLTAIFGILAATEVITPEAFKEIFVMIVSFYFCVQVQKKAGN